MLAVAALLARAAVARGQLLLLVPAGVVALAGLLLFGVLAPRRDATIRCATDRGGPGSDLAAVRRATAVVVLTALTALATELAHRR